MTLKMMGKKIGMTQLFDKEGNLVVCSIISAEPNVVTQIRTEEKDGYTAIQLGAIKHPKKKNVAKPNLGAFTKAGIEPRRHLSESRLEKVDQYTVGQEIDVSHFADISYVDVRGVSRGKGHQGVMRRHNFAGGPASHGSGFHRHGGSCGMRSTPGRCLPGQKKSGHMGDETVTVQNLKIVKVDAEKQVIIVEGAIPGSPGGLVYIQKAKKKTK